jgi:large subunit ribosomal protein L9
VKEAGKTGKEKKTKYIFTQIRYNQMPTINTSEKNRLRRPKRLPKGPHGGVELLLIQPIEHLGKQGDVVEVKRGYALNFLIPQGLATIANEHHKRMVEKHRAQLEAIEKARLVGLQSLANDLARQSITIEANANDEGHLYGSVNAVDVSNALKRAGFHIATDQVRLTGPLKELGLYTIKIHLGSNIEGEVKIWVVPSVVTDDENAGK